MSVSAHNLALRKPLNVSSLDRETYNWGLTIAREALAGVGIPEPEVVEVYRVAIHLRRKATLAECNSGAPYRRMKGRP